MKQLALVALLVSVAACSSSTPETSKPAAPAPAPATPPAAASGPRVFFEEPKDGATVKGPLVHLKFNVENFTIGAVPPDPVTTVRPNIGHYHVGYDTDCLPPGTEIVKGTPTWIHFGKGDDQMDMQMTPGQHKLALQIGDDKHVTLPGLCQQITVTVTE
jgi:uncharacterized protein DUF4399/uncharacterized protein DUF6130